MQTDTIAGRYRIVREIARSNDIVFEAMDTALNRRIAVKELLLPPNLTGDPLRERIARFNREAKAAGSLSHPNIVTVYDYGQDGPRYFIAMEYLEGVTLRDRIQTSGSIPPTEAVDIAAQVLHALAHAHDHRVIHRDVKPDNIHIIPGGLIKLTDFGIARISEEPSLTGTGQIFGTPSYMSPEQIEGRDIDHRTDLFSLGVVLYEMLAGRKPFTGDSVVSITYAIMNAQPPPLSQTPPAIEQVVMRALGKRPEMRPASADELRMDLRNAERAPASFSAPGFQLGPADPRTMMPGSGLGAPPQGSAYPAPGPQPGLSGAPPAPPVWSASGVPQQPGWTAGGALPSTPPPPAVIPQAPPPAWLTAAHRGAVAFAQIVFWAAVIAAPIAGLVWLFLTAYARHAQPVQAPGAVSTGAPAPPSPAQDTPSPGSEPGAAPPPVDANTAKDTREGEVLLARGDTLWAQQQYDGAVDAWLAARRVPGQSQAYEIAGQRLSNAAAYLVDLSRRSSSPEEARTYLDAAGKADPRNPGIHEERKRLGL